MMFPSAEEPFSYPSQPLTTFETSQQFAKNNPYSGQSFGNVDATSPMDVPPSRGRDDNMEAQFFALPPYIEQRQQQQQQQAAAPTSNMGFDMSLGGPRQAMGAPNGWAPQQGGVPQADAMSNINIQDIFGGSEWFGLNNPSGYQ